MTGLLQRLAVVAALGVIMPLTLGWLPPSLLTPLLTGLLVLALIILLIALPIRLLAYLLGVFDRP